MLTFKTSPSLYNVYNTVYTHTHQVCKFQMTLLTFVCVHCVCILYNTHMLIAVIKNIYTLFEFIWKHVRDFVTQAFNIDT